MGLRILFTERHDAEPAADRRRRRWPFALGALVLVVGAAGLVATRLGDDEASADDTSTAAAERLVEVTSGTVRETVPGEGTIEPETTADLSFASSGTVTSVAVAIGDDVAAGDVLATIESAALDADRAEAQAAADEAAAELADAPSDASDAELAALQAQVDTADLALLDAQEAVDGATLTAPVAGTVTVVDYAVGDVLGSSGSDGTDLSGSDTPSGGQVPTGASDGSSDTGTSSGIQVVSTGTYTVTIDVSATEVGQLAVGQEALVTPTTSSSSTTEEGPGGFVGGPMGGAFPGLDGGSDTTGDAEGTASGDQVSGTITEVAAVADTSSGVATFPVEVTVEGSPDAFFPGAVAEVELVVAETADVLQIPAFAVTTTDGVSTVVVADGDAREERTVEVGEADGTMVEVLSGLTEGEQVVLTMPSRTGDDGDDGGGGGGGGAPPVVMSESGAPTAGASATDEGEG